MFKSVTAQNPLIGTRSSSLTYVFFGKAGSAGAKPVPKGVYNKSSYSSVQQGCLFDVCVHKGCLYCNLKALTPTDQSTYPNLTITLDPIHP